MSFKSWNSYRIFCNSISSKNRYILDDESKDFLNSILDTCKDRVREIGKGTILWRTQNGSDFEPIYSHDEVVDEKPYPYLSKRMKPLSSSASDGRANSKGIPCLYLATKKETAIAEVRPWLGSILSVGQFKTNKDLRLIDFSVEDGNTGAFYFSEPAENDRNKAVWCHIDNSFSKPIQPSDLKSEYAPTQIIAEFIKSKGYDGIAYKSSLSEGHNVALFDLSAADLINCAVHEVKKIKFDFSQIDETVFVESDKNT